MKSFIAFLIFSFATVAAAPLAAHPGPVPSSADRAAAVIAGTDDPAAYIVQLQDPPLALYKGGIGDLAATNPRTIGQTELDVDSAASQAYLDYLVQQQSAFLATAATVLGHEPALINSFQAALNGVGLWLTSGEAETLEGVSSVKSVQKEFVRELTTDAGPEWIGAPAIWNGNGTLDDVGTMGEGIIVGVIDSGVNHDHPSFAEVGPEDGHIHQNPLADGNPLTPDYLGACEPNTGLPYCNDKLIGAYDCTQSAGVGGGGGGGGSGDPPIVTPLNGGTYTETMCSALDGPHPFPAGGASLTLAAADPITTNDITVHIWYDDPTIGEPIKVADGDLLTSPETAIYAPSDGVPAGDYFGQICPFSPPPVPFIPPTTYQGTFTWEAFGVGSGLGGCTAGASPEDFNGHGSHTASTSAGNFVIARVEAPTITLEREVKGVAPHANLITYLACVPTGSCVSLNLTAAIEQAIMDEVDVINYSIGGGSSNPYSDADAQAFLSAREAGVWVATSAGNDGPNSTTIGSPADAPWLTGVAAMTHNREFANALIDMTGGGSPPPDDIFGKSVTSGYGPDEIVYAGDFPSACPTNGPELCACGDLAASTSPWPPGTFNGEIVICDRGTFARVDKCRHAGDAGAGGCVLANDAASGESTVADPHSIPAVHISFDDGVVLKTWQASGSGHMGTIRGTEADLDPDNGDLTAGFSSRGPNPSLLNNLKPDVGNPGVDILAAVATFPDGTPADDPEFSFLSGTSMSSPHTAGSFALLHAKRPELTAAEAQSALMLTSNREGTKDDNITDPADPFDRGAGRVDLNNAALAQLVLDEDDYGNNPADARDLNIASMADVDCDSMCTWTREVRGTGPDTVTWTGTITSSDKVIGTVSPSSFTLAPGQTQVLTITADVRLARHATPRATENIAFVEAPFGDPCGSLPNDCWVFADVELAPGVAGVPAAHMPIAARSTGDFDGDGTPDLIDACPLSTDDTSDADSDGVPDDCDNCLNVANPDQCNTNAGTGPGQDLFGNLCDADLDNDGGTTQPDLGIFRSQFGQVGNDLDADLNCDGGVTQPDLGIFRSLFNQPPGPSGLNN